jgi:hypothetical protein
VSVDLVILDDPIPWPVLGRVVAVEEDDRGVTVTGELLPEHAARVAAWLFPSAVQAAAEFERAREQLARVFADTAEQLRPVLESLGLAAQQTGVSWAQLIDRWREDWQARQVGKLPPPVPELRQQDPRAYALQLRQARGTGPARLVQQQHRPRRHR